MPTRRASEHPKRAGGRSPSGGRVAVMPLTIRPVDPWDDHEMDVLQDLYVEGEFQRQLAD